MRLMTSEKDFIARINSFRNDEKSQPTTQRQLFDLLEQNMRLLLQGIASTDESNDFSRSIVALYLEYSYECMTDEITPKTVVLNGKEFWSGGTNVFYKDTDHVAFWSRLKEAVNRHMIERFNYTEIAFVLAETQDNDIIHPGVIRQYFNELVIDPILEYLTNMNTNDIIEFTDVTFRYLTTQCFNAVEVSKNEETIAVCLEELRSTVSSSIKMFSSDRLKMITKVGKNKII